MLSGWNCIPSTGELLCLMPMIIPSSVVAEISNSLGILSFDTTREWYLVALNVSGRFLNKPFWSLLILFNFP